MDYRILNITILMMLLTSCKDLNFSTFENSDVHYNIYRNDSMILRALNTEGVGARKLQLFDNCGNFIEEVIIHNVPFKITEWVNGVVTIQFKVSQLNLFLPWFNQMNNKPLKIGNYKLHYDYEEVLGSNIYDEIQVDSLSFSIKSNKVFIYQNKTLMEEKDLDSLTIHKNKLVYSKKSKDNIYLGKVFRVNENLITDLLRDVLCKK